MEKKGKGRKIQLACVGDNDETGHVRARPFRLPYNLPSHFSIPLFPASLWSMVTFRLEWVFSLITTVFFFFFMKFKIPFISSERRSTDNKVAGDYPRIPTYGHSGRHRPTIDRRCIALKKKKKDVFLAAAYRGVPLSTSSSPTYSYVFTYVTTRLSRSPVLFVRRVARGIEGERCGPKKKKREGERFIIVAQWPWTLRSFFRLFFFPTTLLDFTRHFFGRVSSIYTELSVQMTFWIVFHFFFLFE